MHHGFARNWLVKVSSFLVIVDRLFGHFRGVHLQHFSFTHQDSCSKASSKLRFTQPWQVWNLLDLCQFNDTCTYTPVMCLYDILLQAAGKQSSCTSRFGRRAVSTSIKLLFQIANWWKRLYSSDFGSMVFLSSLPRSNGICSIPGYQSLAMYNFT